MSDIDFSQMPNPMAPEAWLTPEEANKHRIYIYVLVSGLCIVLWDMLSCFPEDFTITFRRKWSPFTFLFLVLRFFTLGFLLAGTISLTQEVSNCQTANFISCAFNLIALTTTNILLYLKACQVYRNKIGIVSLFGVACAAVLAGPILDFFALLGRHIEPTFYCQLVVRRPGFMVTPILQGIFGLIICLAMVYKLSSETQGVNSTVNWKSVFNDIRGAAFWFNEKFLKNDQLYLLIASAAKIPSIVAFFVFRGSSSATQLTFTVLDLSVVSIMVAKLYRKALLGKPLSMANNAPVTTIDNLGFIVGSTGSTSMSTSTQEGKMPDQQPERDFDKDQDIKSESAIV